MALRETFLPDAGPMLWGLDPATAGYDEGTVYLLHLVRPYVARTGLQLQSFQHYTGHAEPGLLVKRIRQHGTADGARCMQVAAYAGLDWLLARTWPGGYPRERQIKNQGSARRFCPLCGVVPRNTQPGRQK